MMPGQVPVHHAADNPGLFPLRPLAIGEILTSAVRVARAHLGLLAPVALVAGILTSGTNLAVLAAFGELRAYSTQAWIQVPAHPSDAWVQATLGTVGHILVAFGALAAVSLVTTPILVGLASSCAAESATSRAGHVKPVLARLRGRWWRLIGAGVLAGLLTVVGFVALVVPGILLWLMLIPTGPVAALEGARPVAALRRAAVLSRGFKPRLFGVSLLAALLSGLVGLMVVTLVGAFIPSPDAVRGLLVSQAIAVLAGAFTAAWSSTVTALLYIDIRMRREGLADSLRRAAYAR